jgi:4,5-DOPA dioxygenase extradiol
MSNNESGRRAVLTALGALGFGAVTTAAFGEPTSLNKALDVLEALPAADAMPALFVGHGTPFSAIDPNVWTAQWARLGATLPRPKAILSISAHWLTRGAALVTAAPQPPMNYDISGFPRAIYEYRYPAPGNPAIARDIAGALKDQIQVFADTAWGFDHGTWLVLKYMYPKADIPVLQLSIDFSRPPEFHYELAKRLRALRSKGILILGSGNVVHNLSERGGTGVTDRPHDWAIEFDRRMTTAVMKGDHAQAVNFLSLGTLARQAHPSYDHFLPLLYCLGVAKPGGAVRTFCEGFQWPGISMRGFVLG